MSRIDRISRAFAGRRVVRVGASQGETAAAAGSVNLPVPVGAAERVTPPPPVALGGESGFEAHVMGQEGQRRGLRAGPGYLEEASRAYNRVEWSGRWDRRARSGRQARTEI